MRRSPLLVALVAPLAACAIASHRAPDTQLPAVYEAPRGGAELAAADLDHWWLLFADPALNALEDEAFRSAPDARTAAARVLEARATRDSLVAQTLPTGNLAGNANKRHTVNEGAASSSLIPVGGDSTSETLNFNVSWELDFFGRLAQARKVAGGDQAATRFNIEGSRATLAASVADDYFQVRGLAIQLSDARETARIQGQLQSVAQRKADLGLGPASDADRVAGDLAQAQSQVQNYQAELHAAQRGLLVLIGHGADPTASVPSEPASAESEAQPSVLARSPMSATPRPARRKRGRFMVGSGVSAP